MSIVIENLKEALKGESEAQKKYELYAEKAKKQKLEEIAHLFRAVSFAESIHIKNHTRALSVIKNKEVNIESFVQVNESELKKSIKDTRRNLEDAIEGETYETKTMYRDFVKNAKKEDLIVAELSFSLARNAEKEHTKLFSNFLNKLRKEKNLPSIEIFVCKICGNVELREKPESCPVCDHDSHFFKKIE